MCDVSGRWLVPRVLAGGRAGRHGKKWDFGEVTCFRDQDMQYMKKVSRTPCTASMWVMCAPWGPSGSHNSIDGCSPAIFFFLCLF